VVKYPSVEKAREKNRVPGKFPSPRLNAASSFKVKAMLSRLVIVLSLPLMVRSLPTTEPTSSSSESCSNETEVTPPTQTTLCQPHLTVPPVVLLHGSYQCVTGMPSLRPARDDYFYSPGVGAHKLHTRATTWNNARKMCNDEGGHLAIINSIIEAHVRLLPSSLTYLTYFTYAY
jgi:hypothetical protein